MRRSAGRAPQTGSEVCGWALSLREEKQLLAGHWEPYVQSQGRSPQLTRPLPACHTPSTVTPHPLPSPTPQPPCSTSYPAPACPTHHMYSKENPSHLLPSCAGVSLAQSHPWEAGTRSKSLSSAGICCTPQPPQPRSTAWLGAKGLPISHPGVHGCHQGTVGSLAEGSQDCRVYGPPCGEHTGTPRPREMKGPSRVALPGLSHPHLPWLIFLSTKRAYTSSSKASLS